MAAELLLQHAAHAPSPMQQWGGSLPSSRPSPRRGGEAMAAELLLQNTAPALSPKQQR